MRAPALRRLGPSGALPAPPLPAWVASAGASPWFMLVPGLVVTLAVVAALRRLALKVCGH